MRFLSSDDSQLSSDITGAFPITMHSQSSLQTPPKPPVQSALMHRFGSTRGKRYASEISTIWMVEDDRADRLIGHQYIMRNFPGIQLRCFETARELNAALSVLPFPSLLILDLGLPDADGIAILEDVHKSRKTTGLNDRKIIVLTGRDVVEVEAECRRFGAMVVLSKYACTGNYDHLVSCIEIALRVKRG